MFSFSSIYIVKVEPYYIHWIVLGIVSVFLYKHLPSETWGPENIPRDTTCPCRREIGGGKWALVHGLVLEHCISESKS